MSSPSALAGQNPTPQTIAAIRVQLGLNRPVVVQYGHWIWSALQGNLGRSLFTAESVTGALGNRVPVTVSLALGALREWASTQLADYKLPAELVTVAALPRNANGKIIKKQLAGELAVPRPPSASARA